jgi:hypothetical protein
MTIVKSQTARFYRRKSGHAPTRVYIQVFGYWVDDKCWWCADRGSMAAQTQEHHFPYCSQWTDQDKVLLKAVGKVMGWKAGRCQHVQISELLSRHECGQAMVDFLVASEVGMLPPK